MTMAEVCEVTGLDKHNAASILMGLNNVSARKPKRVYIVKYVFDHEGARRYPRAVYDIGDHEDARKPKADERANKRRYRAAKKVRMKANFVFNLAQPVRI